MKRWSSWAKLSGLSLLAWRPNLEVKVNQDLFHNPVGTGGGKIAFTTALPSEFYNMVPGYKYYSNTMRFFNFDLYFTVY